MGAHAYWYTVPYNEDLEMVLADLREREFRAGRYNPAMLSIDFPITPASPAPGPRHDTIEDALAASGADGTRSILDIVAVGDEPDFGTACPLSAAVLRGLYGTDRPTRGAVEADDSFTEDIERGRAVYVLLYESDRPTAVYFAGYSCD